MVKIIKHGEHCKSTGHLIRSFAGTFPHNETTCCIKRYSTRNCLAGENYPLGVQHRIWLGLFPKQFGHSQIEQF